MNLPNPMNSINKIPKLANHLLYSTMVSSCLALMACTMLAPNTQKQTANYVDPKASATHETTNDSNPAYSWFY
jgi:hypothetical protein